MKFHIQHLGIQIYHIYKQYKNQASSFCEVLI